MENNFQTTIASVQNMPKEKTDRYLVARLNMNLLWYWGSWDTKEAAERVAEQFENGVVLERTDNEYVYKGITAEGNTEL